MSETPDNYWRGWSSGLLLGIGAGMLLTGFVLFRIAGNVNK